MTPKKPKTGIFLVDVFHSTYLWRISFSFFFCLVWNLPRKNIWGNLSQNSTCYCIDDFQFKKVLFLTFGWDQFARTTMFSGQDSFVYCSILNRLYNNNYEGQVFLIWRALHHIATGKCSSMASLPMEKEFLLVRYIIS